MSEGFDPYHAWLSISPREQPANHYRLLGLELFENDSAVIERAADRQRAYLRQHQHGPHSGLSQQLLNEVTQAALCLLDPRGKASYDASLRQSLAPQAARSASPDAPIVAPSDQKSEANEPEKLSTPFIAERPKLNTRQRPRMVSLLIPFLLVLIAVGSSIAFLRRWSRSTQQPVATAQPNSPAKGTDRTQSTAEPTPLKQSTAVEERPPDKLRSGDVLAPGESIFSENGRYELEFQEDGNLVLRRADEKVLWATHTSGRAATCAMQTDGNLVLSDAAGRPVWASHTSLRPGAELVLQNDGNAVIYLLKTSLWATKTRE